MDQLKSAIRGEKKWSAKRALRQQRKKLIKSIRELRQLNRALAENMELEEAYLLGYPARYAKLDAVSKACK